MYPVTYAERAAVEPRCFFLKDDFGHLAAMYFRPPSGVQHRADLLYIHPFCHEIYNSRSVMAMCFRQLAEAGIGVLAVDLPGCGDSEGGLEDASWEIWKNSIINSLHWLQNNSGRPVSLCGLRLGGALALEVSLDCHSRPGRFILLEPTISGEEMMTQYLRARVAFSGIRGDSGQRETTAGLRERLGGGESLEVAGFILTQRLVAAIDRVDLRSFQPDPAIPIDWVAIAPAGEVPVVEAWRGTGVPVRIHQVAVRPYWPHTRGVVGEYDLLARCLTDIFEGSAS